VAKSEGNSALKEGERYTLDQWKSWPEGERWELIGGVAYNMSPSHRMPHQRMSFHLAFERRKFMDGKYTPVRVRRPRVRTKKHNPYKASMRLISFSIERHPVALR
jgi:hypothetical protein